ncbi:MAG TPA: hypothetical protein VK168_15650 [Saprospiraceae bacterium]|nr:hypothetical protein [Saprospiraceae bacterium]
MKHPLFLTFLLGSLAVNAQITDSAGEALAVMFKGRRQTRFFGEKNGGMITVTDWTLSDADLCVKRAGEWQKKK